MHIFSMLEKLQLTGEVGSEKNAIFKSMASQARPFVFVKDEEFSFTLDSYENLDLPFDVCFFEAPKNETLFELAMRAEDPRICIFGVLVSDNDCFVIGSVGVEGKTEVYYASLKDRSKDFCTQIVELSLAGIKHILDRLNKFDLLEGVQHHKRKIKGNGVSRRIGDVVYLLPKKGRNPSDKTSIPESVRHINFSHRFLRRGHWRVVGEKTIGKNRHGERVELGRTWVKSSEIGEGILKEKLRVFK